MSIADELEKYQGDAQEQKRIRTEAVARIRELEALADKLSVMVMGYGDFLEAIENNVIKMKNTETEWVL